MLGEYDVITDGDQNIYSNLILCHFNVRSLTKQFDEFKNYILSESFDIITISETWLTADIPDYVVDIPGYQLYRNDRKHVRGGGVAIYVRKCKNIANINIILPDDNGCVEHLWLTTHINGKKVGIGCVYRPPNCPYNNIQVIENFLADFSVSCEYFFCLGDLNINILHKNTPENIFLENLTKAFNLIQLINKPTRITLNTSSLIDLIFTNNDDITFKSDVIDLPQFSDHHLVYCAVNIPLARNTPRYIYRRDIKNINLNKFELDASNTDWNQILTVNNLNEKVQIFNNLIIKLFDIHAPIQKIKISKNRCPWITANIRLMMRIRDKALSEYRASLKNIYVTQQQTKIKWNYYKNCRNYVTAAIRREKKAYIEHILNRNTNNSKALWQTVNKLNIYSKNKNSIIPDNIADPNEINNYYINSVDSIKANPSTIEQFKNSKYHNLQNGNNFDFTLASTTEISNIVKELRSNAKGLDDISAEMLKLCLPFCLKILTHIINCSLEINCVPSSWKWALITPIPKKENINNINELRPISILPTLSKVLERYVYLQLKKYIDTINILPERQSGFRSGFSTATTLLDITDDMLQGIDNKQITVTVMLDYSKAFDCIDHELLLAKLKYYGLSLNALNWFKNYLSDRYQIVQIVKNDTIIRSRPASIHKGVPQGSILGPLLFILYTADVQTCVQSKMHCYADDCQIYLSFQPDKANYFFPVLNFDLDCLNVWSANNALKLNPTKTTALLVGTEKQCDKISLHDKIFINNLPVSTNNYCKNLGLTIDQNLNFTRHVNEIIKVAYSRLKCLYKFRNILNTSVKLKLTESLIMSVLDYCDVVYGPCLSVADSNKIQVLQNTCMRYSAKVKRRDHITPYFVQHGWIRMDVRRSIHYLCLLHKIMQTNRPSYLKHKLVFGSDVHNISMRNTNLLHVPRHSTSYFKGSFSYQAASLYNMLPQSVRNVSSHSVFKQKVKDLLGRVNEIN